MSPHATASAPKTKPKPPKAGNPILQKDGSTSIVYGIALVVVTVIAYAGSLHGKFIFDDQQIVMQNPKLMNVRTFGDVLAMATGWRQLLFFTYGLNYYWSGLDTKLGL